MARKTFYTDKLGRRWKWDASLKKYQYIRKDAKQIATVVVAQPSNVRNLDIYAAYQQGESAKDLAAKHGLSIARLRQIIYQQKRIAATPTAAVPTIPPTVKKVTAKREINKKAELYANANDRAKRLSDVTGVLPLGKEAENYIESNLQSIFAKTKTQVAYLRGVDVEQPLGKPGSWLQDEKFVDQIIVEMQKIVDDLNNPTSDYYIQTEAVGTAVIEALQSEAQRWVDKLTEMKSDKKILFEEMEEFDSIAGDACGAVSRMASSVMAQIIPYEDWQALDELDIKKISDKELSWNNLPSSVKLLLAKFGIDDELYNRKRWSIGALQSLIIASFYPEMMEEYMKLWLEPQSFDADGRSVMLGGQGNVEEFDEPVTVEVVKKSWLTFDMWKAGAERLRNEFKREADFLTKYTFLRKQDAIQHQIYRHEPFRSWSAWRQVSGSSGYNVNRAFLPAISYRGGTQHDVKYKDAKDKYGTAMPNEEVFSPPFKDMVSDFRSLYIYKHLGKSGEATSNMQHDLQATDKFIKYASEHNVPVDTLSVFDGSDGMASKVFGDLSSRLSSSMAGIVKLSSYGYDRHGAIASNSVRVAAVNRAQAISAGKPYDDPLSPEYGVERSMSVMTGGYRGRYRRSRYGGGGRYMTTRRETVYDKEQKGSDKQRNGVIRSVYDKLFNGIGMSSDVAGNLLKLAVGSNYHLRKLTKYRKKDTPFLWGKLKPYSKDVVSNDIIRDVDHAKYTAFIEDGRKELVARDIIGKGKKRNLPAIVIADAPPADKQKQQGQFDSSWDKTNHGSFVGKLTHTFRIMYHPYYDKYKKIEQAKGNVRYLYHGTHFEAGTSIVKGGFKIPKKVKAGRMLGDGVYLADASSKSCQYLGTGFSRHGQHGVLLLCRAALGKLGTNQWDDSVDTVERTKSQGLVNWECVVKNPEAVVPIYWLDIESV